MPGCWPDWLWRKKGFLRKKRFRFIVLRQEKALCKHSAMHCFKCHSIIFLRVLFFPITITSHVYRDRGYRLMQVMHRALVLFISAIKLAFCKNDFGFCCSLHRCNFSIFVLAFDFSLLKVKVSILKYRFIWIRTQQVRHRTNRRHSREASMV